MYISSSDNSYKNMCIHNCKHILYVYNVRELVDHLPKAVHKCPFYSAITLHKDLFFKLPEMKHSPRTGMYNATSQPAALSIVSADKMWECFGEESSERILVVQTVPQTRCCVWPCCSNLGTMREPLLHTDTQRPSEVAVHAAWWKCWKPAPPDGQGGRIQWPSRFNKRDLERCDHIGESFSKTLQSALIPSNYSKNTPLALPAGIRSLGKVTFIHFHRKEPWSSASPLRWDLPPALLAALSIPSAPLAP